MCVCYLQHLCRSICLNYQNLQCQYVIGICFLWLPRIDNSLRSFSSTRTGANTETSSARRLLSGESDIELWYLVNPILWGAISRHPLENNGSMLTIILLPGYFITGFSVWLGESENTIECDTLTRGSISHTRN